MQSVLARKAAFIGSLLILTACASAEKGASLSPAVQPPVLLSSGIPNWRYAENVRNGTLLDLRIEVNLDAAGQPILETLKVTGIGAMDNRGAVIAWLHTARFRPAQQGGQPVPGVYRRRVAVKATTQRVG